MQEATSAVVATAALYLRVSTELQARDDRWGLQSQESRRRRYAEAHGLLVTAVYTDTISGTRETRHGLEQLKRQAPRYGAVIISSVDRLARAVGVSYRVYGEPKKAGRDVHTADSGVIDLDDDAAALSFGFRAVLADYERRSITERLYNGKLQKARSGKTVGPIKAYGYRDGAPFEPHLQWVRWMFEETRHRGSCVLARELNAKGITAPAGGAWSSSAIDDILANPVYRGTYLFGL